MCDDKDLKKLEKELKEKESSLTEKKKSLQETKEKLRETENELKIKEEEFEELEAKKSDYLAQLQRMQADFENYKKNAAKQQAQIIEYANENLILKILDVYQDFERALESCKTQEDFKNGLELIYNKLKKILEKEGLKEIPVKAEKFDPYKHEAMMAENHDEYENGMIIDELSKGYTLKDKVIKYSMVKVCKKK